MALAVADRVKESTTTTGTGTVSLAGAETGFQTFVAGIGNSNTTYYAIVDGNTGDFEVGIGTVTDASPDTLSRDTILQSSNSDSAVNFGAGTKSVFCTQPADKAVFKDADGHVALPDSAEIRLGNRSGGDLKIRYNGSNNQIQGFTGALQLTNFANDQDVRILSDDSSGGVTDYFRADGSNGEAVLYHYGTEKLATKSTGVDVVGNITVSGTVDGRDLATDGTKLDGIEASADVTDTANVTSAGALMTSGGAITSATTPLTATTSSSSGESAAHFKRSASNGSLVTFENSANVTVGVISTTSNDLLIGTGDTGLYFEDSTNEIEPFNPTNRTSTNGVISLGASNRKFKDLYLGGNITVDGTVDGRDLATDGTKLDGIESNATADQTAAEIRTLVESASDSNVFTDADHTKLNGIASSATANPNALDNISEDTTPQLGGNLDVNGNQIQLDQTSGVAIKTVGDLSSADLTLLQASHNNSGQYGFNINYMGSRSGNANSFALEMHNQNGTNVEAITVYQDGKVGINNTAPTAPLDVTGNIVVSGTVDGRDLATDGTKLDGIEASADVTDTANVTSAGALMTTGGTMTGAVLFNDSVNANFGTGTDLSITHNGTNTQIINRTGVLQILQQSGSDVVIKGDDNSGGSSADYFRADGSTGEAMLYHYGTEKLATKSGGVDVSGNITVSGTVDGRDLATDGTKLDGIEASADVTDTANVTSAGALMDSEVTNLAQVKAFDSSDYATAAQGTTADAALPKAGGTMTGNIKLNDDVDIRMGAGNDFKLFHNGTNSKINNSTGALQISNFANDQDVTIATDDGSGATAVYFRADGSTGDAILSHYGTEKIKTQSGGIDVTGNITVSGTVDGRDVAADGATADAALPKAGGTLTGDLAFGDNVKAKFGAGNDLKIYHDGAKSVIEDQGTGALQIRGTDLKLRSSGSEEYIECIANGAVTLYHDNSAKLATASSGIDVTGNITVSGTVDGRDVAADGATADAALPKAGGTMTGNISRGDNVKSIYGAGNDLEIYHTGTNSIVNDVGTGNLVLSTNGTSVRIAHSTNAEAMAVFTKNGSALLNHDGSNKLETSSSGVDVTGDIAVTGSVVFEGATADAHETTLAVTDPTADRTITLPDATGTVILNSNLNFPFFKADGSSDTIALTADNKLPFVKSDGSASNIALTT